MIKKAIHGCLRLLGFDVIRYRKRKQGYPPDFGQEDIAIIREVGPLTMTSPERLEALIQGVRYITANQITGAIVECGVWKGGSMAAVAKTLLHAHVSNRDLFLFDTFTGMSDSTSKDVDYSGKQAKDVLLEDPGYLCDDAPLERVKNALYETGYPQQKLHFIAGKVEDTLPALAPDSISLLRLDTDWYESTKHELVHLFPRVAHGGVIIIDDYGHWRGSRRACDEYFTENRIPILLNRIDYTGRIALKP